MASDQPPNNSNNLSFLGLPDSPTSTLSDFSQYILPPLEGGHFPSPSQAHSPQQRQQQSQASRRMSLSNRERAAQLDEILGRGPPSPSTPASPSPRLNRTGLQRPTIISASSSRSGNTAMLSSLSSLVSSRDESSSRGSSAHNGSAVNFTPRVIRANSGASSAVPVGAAASSSQSANQHSIIIPGFNAPSTRTQPRSPVSSSGPSGPNRIIPWSALTRAASSNTPSPAPHVSSPALQTSFPRPSYLDNSALRHLLHSELPPTLPPNRYRFDGSTTESLSNPSIGAQRKRGPLNIDSDDDDTDVSVDGRESPSVPRLPNAPTYLRLPTRWSENDRNTALTIGPGGRELFFQGLEGKESAAAARTNVSIPPACGIYYYEVLILDKGTKGYISIGFSARDVRLTRLPGWESQSWGYHGDDGQVFTGGSELPFGKKFTTGDVIGCGIDFTTHRAFYTKGGVFINSVFNDVGAKAEIFPSVGLRSQGESIRANFGQEPFKFDINAYVQQERTRVWRAIQSTPIDVVDDHFQLPPGAKLPSLEPGSMATNKANEPPRKTLKRMNELIYAYLVHHGYSGTARAFRSHPESQLKLTKERGKITSAPTSMSNEEQSMDLDPAPQELGADPSHPHSGTAVEEEEEEEDKEDLAVISRQNIVRAVLSGDIDTAISETSSKYPEVLEVQDGIMLFKLKCRKFVEMILDVAEAYRKEVEVGAGTGTGVEGYRDGRNGKGVGSGESEAEVESVVLPTTASSSSAAAIGSAGSAFPPLSSPTSPMTSTSNGTGNGAGTGGVSGGVFDMDMEVDGDVQSSSHHATNGHGHSAPDSAFFASSSTLPPPSSSTPVPDPTTSIDPSLASSSRHPPPSHLSPQPQLESHPSAPTETSSYQSLFLLARAYGQSLSTTYKHDRRSSIQTSIKRASSLIAFVDPLRAEREEVGSLAGQGARNELAGELNRAILESMGLPTTPALEKMYCQSVAAVTVLGCYGVGAAAFADTRREFLED